MSKVQQALEYVAQGMNPHAAAIQAGAAPTHVYKAIKRARKRAAGICECCGQALPTYTPDEKTKRMKASFDAMVEKVYPTLTATVVTIEEPVIAGQYVK